MPKLWHVLYHHYLQVNPVQQLVSIADETLQIPKSIENFIQEAFYLMKVLNLKPAKEHNPKSTNNTQIEVDRDLLSSTKCLHLRNIRERHIYNLHKIYKRITIILSRTQSPHLNPKRVQFSIYKEKKTPSNQLHVR